MFNIIMAILIGLFAALLFINIYFRVKVLKVYRKLVENRVEFGARHIFSKSIMEAEILPKYPRMREEILLFVRHIHYSIGVAILLIILISFFAAVLLYS